MPAFGDMTEEVLAHLCGALNVQHAGITRAALMAALTGQDANITENAEITIVAVADMRVWCTNCGVSNAGRPAISCQPMAVGVRICDGVLTSRGPVAEYY